MSNPELLLQVVLLLETEPTRSAEVRHIHRQIRERLGPRSPSLAELYSELRSNRSFLLLERTADLDSALDPGYGPALEAAGLRPSPRVLLAAEEPLPDRGDPLVLAAGSLRTLLQRAPELAPAVGAAFAQVDRLASRAAAFAGPAVDPAPAGLRGAGTAPSTTLPPGPRHRARGRRHWRSPACRPPPPGESRSG